MFTKENYDRWCELTDKPTTDELIELNHKMIETYPWLAPRIYPTDILPPDFDYSYNEWSKLSLVWRLTIGWDFLNELHEAILQMDEKISPEVYEYYTHRREDGHHLRDAFRIMEIGERGNAVFIDYNIDSASIEKVVNKYADLSYNILYNFTRKEQSDEQ